MARRVKLDDRRINHMRQLYSVRKGMLAQADNFTLQKLARQFGVSYATAHAYCEGRKKG